MIQFNVSYEEPELMDGNNASLLLAIQVEKDTRPFVPALTMSLNQRTRVMGNKVVYPGPFARYLYKGKVMVDSLTGKGPAHIPEVGYRFRKGAVLMPTDRNLNFSTSPHPQAQAHWFEGAKAKNLEKWKRIAAELLTDGK